jgi:uncharacterized integral membrane protein
VHCFWLASFPIPCAQLQTLSSLLGWGGLRLVFWLFLLVVCLVNESHMELWLRSGAMCFPVGLFLFLFVSMSWLIRVTSTFMSLRLDAWSATVKIWTVHVLVLG